MSTPRFAALLLAAVVLTAGPTTVKADDAIRPYAENPYYWQYKGEPVLLLGGSWQDNLFNHPTGLARHLDLLVQSGGNYLRNTMSHRNAGNVFAYARRDGKFDLDEFNDEYWQRFDNFLRLTHERDIIVQIEIFDPWDHFVNHQSLGGWSHHPFNPANNVTYTPEESGLPTAIDYNPVATPSEHPFYLSVPALENNELVLRYQRAYVDKLLSISLEYPHVLYCIQNESGEQLAFGDYWVDHVYRRSRETGRTVFVSDMRRNGDVRASDQRYLMDNPRRFAFLDISQIIPRDGQTNYDNFLYVREYIADNPRPINSTKLYNRHGDEESVARMFRIIFAGGASARFHRPHPLEGHDDHEKSTGNGMGLSPRAQVTIRSARMLTDAMNVFTCDPRNDLLSDRSENEAYCLAEPGKQYSVYFTDGGAVTLDLSDAPEKLMARWINIQQAEWTEESALRGGGRVKLSAPGERHWAVLIVPGSK